MGRSVIESWKRLSFVARLLTTASCALLVAGAAMVFVSAGQEARDSRIDIMAELAGEQQTLPASLAEVVVIGDFSTLQQTLDRYVGKPKVARVVFIDASGASLVSQDKRLPAIAPDWFVRWLGFQDVTGQAPVLVGGRRYGDLELTMTVQGMANRAWERLLGHLAILALAIFLDFLGIWLVLRTGLVPLRRLEKGAEALARGELATRVEPEGSPEIRHVIDAFNDMAMATQASEGRLRELIDALTRAMEERERFAFIAAHDLQEPLRHVIIFAQRLERQLGSELSPEARMDMESAVQAAWRMRDLINDLLQYSRVNAEGAAFRPFALRNAVDAALEHLIQAVAAARARIEIGELPEVTGDLAQIVSVFVHLISNALRYRHPDLLPEIEVTAERDGGAWIVSVRDNGIGIEASQHERIFDVFRRLHSGNRHGGTGIGLAIVRRIVERHGGRIWVESGGGAGSRFRFTLSAGA